MEWNLRTPPFEGRNHFSVLSIEIRHWIFDIRQVSNSMIKLRLADLYLHLHGMTLKKPAILKTWDDSIFLPPILSPFFRHCLIR